MRAAVYTRVSLDPTGQARSVREQEAECLAVVAREKWTLSQVFTDNDISASRYSRKKRPEFERLIEHVDGGGCDVLVTWEASRFQRDLAVYVQLRDLCRSKGVLWCYSGRTHDLSRTDDRFTTGLDALLAERESDQTRDRILRTMRHQAANGRPHGKGSYGYRRVYDARTGELLSVEIDETEAAVLKEVAARHLTGESFYRLAQELERRGVPNPSGGPRWHPTNLSRLLRNPAYAGLRVHQGAVIGQAVWPPIFDDDTWRHLQAVLTDARRYTTNTRAAAHLLTGLAICGLRDCGAPVRLVKNRGYPAYGCSKAFHVVRRETVLDLYVTEALLAWLERAKREGLDPLGEFEGRASAELEQLEAEVSAVKSRLDDVYAEARTGAISARALAAIEPGLLADLDRLNGTVRRMITPRPVLSILETDNIRAAWQEMDMDHRRAMVKAVVTPAILPTGKGRRTFNPDHIDLRWKVRLSR